MNNAPDFPNVENRKQHFSYVRFILQRAAKDSRYKSQLVCNHLNFNFFHTQTALPSSMLYLHTQTLKGLRVFCLI